MPYPPADAPDRVAGEVIASAIINALDTAIQTIVTELGSSPKGASADLTARLAVLDALVANKQPLDADLTSLAAGGSTATTWLRALLDAIYDAAGAAASAQAASQPLDADLTAIAALVTTAYGRGLLTDADATAFTTRLTGLLNATYVAKTGDETIAGIKTFSSAPVVPADAYDATGWNGKQEPATKDAVRDKLVALTSADLTDFQEAVEDRVGALVGDTSDIDATYNDAGGIESFAIKTDRAADTAITQVASGLTGATATGRHVGTTVSGPPTSGTFAVGDWITSQAGSIWICVAAGTPGTWKRTGADILDAQVLDAGEFVPSIRFSAWNNSSAATSGQLVLHYFLARRSENITSIRTWSGTTPAGATPTICRLGIYSIASNGDGTLVASIANDTTLWASGNTAYDRSLSATWAKVAGTKYAIGYLVVSAAAMPTFLGPSLGAVGVADAELGVAPRLTGVFAGQTDLPGSFTEAGLLNTRRVFAAKLT